MAQFTVNILGCGSATPSLRHNTSCQVIDFRDTLMMVDCGEGAQTQLRRAGLKFSRLRQIFISHLHGDHCLGLTGLLSTLSLHGKGGSIDVYMPEHGVELFKRMLDFFLKERSFEVRFNPIPTGGGILTSSSSLEVSAFPLYHGVPCFGFLFREKPKTRHLKGDMIRFFNIPVRSLDSIREGNDWTAPDGRVIPNAQLTTPASKAYSYAYCSDTVMDERVAESVRGVDVMYHEATYDHSFVEKAESRGHSTALQAATIASMAGAKVLVIGHYSKRYLTPEILVEEAQSVFPRVIAADEGLKIDIPELLKDE